MPKAPLISAEQFGSEPFRIFFPAAVLAGLVGVTLWPLHLAGILAWYPGQNHARLMVCGLFGGFIFGFLGTALPRLLSAHSFVTWQAVGLAGLHVAMTLAFAGGQLNWGNGLFLLLLAGFTTLLAIRFFRRQDLPPPGFVLVALGFLCVTTGTILAVLEEPRELDTFWINFQRLLCFQGFVLLPILGAGPFLLPRFFDQRSEHDLPESRMPSPAWLGRATMALIAGGLLVGSFGLEAAGHYRLAYSLRFATTLIYLLVEWPFLWAPTAGRPLARNLRVATLFLLGGYLFIALFPEYRVGLLHLTLVGGFAVIALIVATRVVFGHSGNLARLDGRNRWLSVAVGLMWFGMVTRISGDFWPKIMATHYSYGALAWVVGMLVWAVNVLPLVLVAEPEDRS